MVKRVYLWVQVRTTCAWARGRSTTGTDSPLESRHTRRTAPTRRPAMAFLARCPTSCASLCLSLCLAIFPFLSPSCSLPLPPPLCICLLSRSPGSDDRGKLPPHAMMKGPPCHDERTLRLGNFSETLALPLKFASDIFYTALPRNLGVSRRPRTPCSFPPSPALEFVSPRLKSPGQGVAECAPVFAYLVCNFCCWPSPTHYGFRN